MKDAETTNLYIAYMNLALLGCGSPPMGMAAVEGVAPIMPIAELINPPPELLATLNANPATSLLLKLARLYWGGK